MLDRSLDGALRAYISVALSIDMSCFVAQELKR